MSRRGRRLSALGGVGALIALGVLVSLVEVPAAVGAALFGLVVAIVAFVVAALWLPDLQREAEGFGLTPMRLALGVLLVAAFLLLLRSVLLSAV